MARGLRSSLCVLLVACLLANAFGVPAGPRLKNTRTRGDKDTKDNTNDEEVLDALLSDIPDKYPNDDVISEDDINDDDVKNVDDNHDDKNSYDNDHHDNDDDEEEFYQDETLNAAQTTGSGSNVHSLLNIAGALFPGSSSNPTNRIIRNMVRQYLFKYQQPVIIRRQDVADNVVDIDYVPGLTPPFQRQEADEEHDDSGSYDDDDDDESSSESEEDNAAEESVENDAKEDNDKASKQDSKGDDIGEDNNDDNGDDDDNDSDYDEPESDGQGGGILGLLAGLSGDEGLDLGTLLATVSQIVGDLSGGDGFDLNAVLATAFGLFVGLLSEGEQNPGTVIASYLLTSLDTITGGGATNNGAFIGNFLSKLLKGTSAADAGSDESSEEEGAMAMADSNAFFISLLMSLSGDMSKTSSAGSSSPW